MQTSRSVLNPHLVYKIQDVANSAKLGFKYLLQLEIVWFFHPDVAPASSEGFSAVCRPRSSSPAAWPYGGPEAAQATQTNTQTTIKPQYNSEMPLYISSCQK